MTGTVPLGSGVSRVPEMPLSHDEIDAADQASTASHATRVTMDTRVETEIVDATKVSSTRYSPDKISAVFAVGSAEQTTAATMER